MAVYMAVRVKAVLLVESICQRKNSTQINAIRHSVPTPQSSSHSPIPSSPKRLAPKSAVGRRPDSRRPAGRRLASRQLPSNMDCCSIALGFPAPSGHGSSSGDTTGYIRHVQRPVELWSSSSSSPSSSHMAARSSVT
jgi:hypothetical protein